MFLVRLAFWMTVLALLLPAPDEAVLASAPGGQALPASLSEAPSKDLELAEVAGAALSSAEDLMSFCDRNPATCETGQAVAHHVQRQFVYYGGRVFGWLAAKGAEVARDAQSASPPASSLNAEMTRGV